MSPLPLVVNIGMHMLLFGPQHHKTAFTLQTAHILRLRSHRCDARQGIRPSEAECTKSQRPEKTFIERLRTPKCKCFEYCLHNHMHIERLIWIEFSKKQPDSLIYPGRLRRARSHKRVYDEAIILSFKCP